MKAERGTKYRNLRAAGLLAPRPDRVRCRLFQEHPEFFDANDHLQVRYELLRSHLVDGVSVVDVCGRFGVSRQTFYMLQARFIREGGAGLLPKKAGPKGPTKLTATVVAFIRKRLASAEQISAGRLLEEIAEEFSVSFHRRTIEKLLKEIASKKNV